MNMTLKLAETLINMREENALTSEEMHAWEEIKTFFSRIKDENSLFLVKAITECKISTCYSNSTYWSDFKMILEDIEEDDFQHLNIIKEWWS